MFRLTGHKDAVMQVAFFPHGNRLASAASDGTIRIWSVHRKRQLMVLDARAGECNSVAISPNGARIASGHADGSVRLWHARSGKQLATLAQHKSHVSRVLFSSQPDTDLVISSAGNSPGEKPPYAELFVFNCKTGETKALIGHSARVTHIALTSDGGCLASVSFDRTVRLWDMTSCQQRFCLTGHEYSLYAVAFSPDDTFLVTGGMDETLRIWDIATGLCSAEHPIEGETGFCAAFLGNESKMFLGTTKYLLQFEDPRTGFLEIFAKTKSTAVFTVVASSDSKYLAWNDNSDVCVWRFEE